MSAKVGSFNIGTGAATTTVAVTGVGFQPTVVLFWWSGRTESTDANGSANARCGFGVGKSATERWAVSNYLEDAVAAATNTATRQNPAACINLSNSAGTGSDGAADVQTMDADGFTLIIDTQFTVDLRVSYLALGGDHSNVAIGDLTPGATGSLSETGLSFQPELVIFCSGGLAGVTATGGADAMLGIGAAAGATQEWTVLGFANDVSTNSGDYSYGDESIASTGVASGLQQRIEFTSFNADGFTVNVLENTGHGVFWVAVAGGQYFVGDRVTATNTSNFSQTGVGFTPEALFVASVGRTESAQDTLAAADMRMSIGAATSSTERTAQAWSDDEGSDPSEVWTAIEHDALYIHGDLADAVDGLMDLVSMDADGFTAVMDDADPAASFVGFVAFGANAAASSVPPTIFEFAVG